VVDFLLRAAIPGQDFFNFLTETSVKKESKPCATCKYEDFCELKDSRFYPLTLNEHASCGLYIPSPKIKPRKPPRQGFAKRPKTP